MAAGAVANIPIVEIANPQIHDRGGDFSRVGNHAGKNSRIVVSGEPQSERQGMIPADSLCERVELRFGNAVNIFGADSKLCHAIDISLCAKALQFGKNLFR
jgi:hypothetical protein